MPLRSGPLTQDLAQCDEAAALFLTRVSPSTGPRRLETPRRVLLDVTYTHGSDAADSAFKSH